MGTIDRDTIVSNPIFINLELCFTMLLGVDLCSHHATQRRIQDSRSREIYPCNWFVNPASVLENQLTIVCKNKVFAFF